MTRLRAHRAALALIGAGLLFRLVLAYLVFPGQGFAIDMQIFAGWAQTLAQVGPAHFYQSAANADYPPGYLYVLWIIGSAPAAAIPQLLKLPAIAADVAIAVLLYRAGRSWWSERAGLLAAALYLFVPVTWLDSALWGQVDAVGALLVIGSLILLVERRSEAAIALAVLAVLVKPQEAIGLMVVIPVLLRRHLILAGSRRRLATSALAGAAAAILPVVPFDIARYAPASLSGVPVLGDIAGVVGLFLSDSARYSVLTANAYNLWALVGGTPLAAIIGGAGGGWTPDSLAVAGGLRAVVVGALALGGVGVLVACGLLFFRDDRLAILLGFTVAAFAFYALPTRVHERYLFPFFTTGALLAAGSLAMAATYGVVGVLNAVNIYAVLAAPLQIATGIGRGGGGFGPGGPPRIGPIGGIGATVTSIRLPLAELARNESTVALVALGQSAALAALVIAWLIVVLRPRRPSVSAPEAPYAPWRASSSA